MDMRDFVSCCLGIGSGKKIDEICDNFGLDIEEESLYELLDLCGEFREDKNRYFRVGKELVISLYEKVIENNPQLDPDKFSYDAQGDFSELMYDGKVIESQEQLDELVKELAAS